MCVPICLSVFVCVRVLPNSSVIVPNFKISLKEHWVFYFALHCPVFLSFLGVLYVAIYYSRHFVPYHRVWLGNILTIECHLQNTSVAKPFLWGKQTMKFRKCLMAVFFWWTRLLDMHTFICKPKVLWYWHQFGSSNVCILFMLFFCRRNVQSKPSVWRLLSHRKGQAVV